MCKDFILSFVVNQNKDVTIMESVKLVSLPKELPLIHEKLLILLINLAIFLHSYDRQY